MPWPVLVKFSLPLALLAIAACIDLRCRRIPNWLTGTLICTGLIQAFSPEAAAGAWNSILGMLTGIGVSVPLFVLGIRGGGDVKLLGGVGAWAGPWGVLLVLLAAAVAGMLLVLVQCAIEGRISQLLRRTGLVVMNLVHARQVGLEPAGEALVRSQLVGRPLPYAVPVLLAAVLLLLVGRMGR